MRNTKQLYDNLVEAGYTGTLQDMLYKYLTSQGYSGAVPDMLYTFLGDRGYSGALTDRMYFWDTEDDMSIGTEIGGGTISPTSITVQEGVAFSQQFTASGGTGPYTWLIVSGSLPGGLTLTDDTVAGTPTGVVDDPYSFTIRATDSNGDYIDQAISGTIEAAYVSATYWRINITDNAGSSYVAIGDLEFRETYGGPQAATGGTISASSELAGSASNVLDGDPSTIWATTPKTAWLSYQFATSISIVEIELTSRTGVTDQTPVDFTIEYSSDGSTWTVANTYSITPLGEAESVVLTVQ